MPASLHADVERATGGRVLERYGMSETQMLISNPLHGERRAGTVGLPLPGVEVRREASSGELLVRGRNVFSGYLNNDAATWKAMDNEGFFRTGDIGEIAPDGYVTLKSRASDLIISGGFNVYPAEVEDACRSFPGVADVAVTGTSDDELGQVVTAWFEMKADATTMPTVASVQTHVRESLARYKQPRIVNVIDKLPRNAMGKVVKTQLKN